VLATPHLSSTGSGQIISLQRYRTEWSHLPLVLRPFGLAVGAILLIQLMSRYIPDAIATVLGALVGLGFMVCVLLMPRRWRQWRAQGRLELRVDGKQLRLFDPLTRRCIMRCSKVTPAEFHYTVTSRYAGGTYCAPALKLIGEDGSTTCVGVQGSPHTWPHCVERVGRPEYVMGAEVWESLVLELGIVERLVPVVNARVGRPQR
jgi:hypothetical protein